MGKDAGPEEELGPVKPGTTGVVVEEAGFMPGTNAWTLFDDDDDDC